MRPQKRGKVVKKIPEEFAIFFPADSRASRERSPGQPRREAECRGAKRAPSAQAQRRAAVAEVRSKDQPIPPPGNRMIVYASK
jgi:hypothetical protein